MAAVGVAIVRVYAAIDLVEMVREVCSGVKGKHARGRADVRRLMGRYNLPLTRHASK